MNTDEYVHFLDMLCKEYKDFSKDWKELYLEQKELTEEWKSLYYTEMEKRLIKPPKIDC